MAFVWYHPHFQWREGIAQNNVIISTERIYTSADLWSDDQFRAYHHVLYITQWKSPFAFESTIGDSIQEWKMVRRQMYLGQ